MPKRNDELHKNRQKSATTTWIDPWQLSVQPLDSKIDHHQRPPKFHPALEPSLPAVCWKHFARSWPNTFGKVFFGPFIGYMLTYFWPKSGLMSLADLFVCSRVARPWPDCSLWDPKNQQRQWMSEGTGSFKIALREQSARFVIKKINCSLDLLISSIKSIYCRSTTSCLLIYQVPNSVDFWFFTPWLRLCFPVACPP